MKKITTVCILALVVIMVAACTPANVPAGDTQEIAQSNGNQVPQVVRLSVEGMTYVPAELTVEANRPVQLVVDGTNAQGCATYFTVPEFGISEKLDSGENVFEFTPTKTGSVPFSCSMQMVNGKLNVVENSNI